MHAKRYLTLGAALAAGFAASVPTGASAHRPNTPPGHAGPRLAPYAAAPTTVSGTWTKLSSPFKGGNPGTALVLTDGTVMMQDGCTRDWYRLTPAPVAGDTAYITGAWHAAAPTPANYAPLFFASVVLPDGRLLINGGEYNSTTANPNCPDASMTTWLGAIYDPVGNTWTTEPGPKPALTGWTSVIDADSLVLATGSYILQHVVGGRLEGLGAVAPPPGTAINWTSTGVGKADTNDEEGWTLLANGQVLTVDVWRTVGGKSPAELYSPIPGTGRWTATGTAPSELADPVAIEIGPSVRLPTGDVFQTGANSCGKAGCKGHTAIYHTSGALAGTWTAGPDFPAVSGQDYDVTDGPAAVLPDGNVLVQASPAYACGSAYCAPSHFYEFNGTAFVRVNEPATAPDVAAYQGRMVVLPTGQILWSDGYSSDVEVYTPTGSPKAVWAPAILKWPATLVRGAKNYAITGIRFRGVSGGAAYGDDVQTATDYPLVRIRNTAAPNWTCFARVHDYTPASAAFDMPSSSPPAWITPCHDGPSTLQVVVNGIPSTPVAVTITGP